MTKKTRTEDLGLVDLLKKAIADSGKTLNQISTAAGVSTSQLWYFMKGQRMLTLPTAEKVMRALNIRLTMVADAAPMSKRPGRRKPDAGGEDNLKV
jgi:DNA-binding phage protein